MITDTQTESSATLKAEEKFRRDKQLLARRDDYYRQKAKKEKQRAREH